MKNIDWEKIQDFYNNNHFWKEILNEFKISSNTLSKAVKSGKLITRTRSESAKIHSSLYPQKHSEETKKKISKIRRKYLKEHPEKVPYLLNHSSKGESYPEKYFREILNKYEMIYEEKYPFSIYQLDFAFLNKSINLEIDGSQHTDDLKIVKSNKRRDKFLKKCGWITIRVDWRKYQKLSRLEKENFVTDLILYINNQSNKIPLLLNKETKSICKCGGAKYYRSKQCLECLHKSQRKVKKRPNIEELIKMIEYSSLEAVGRKYGISGNAVKKWLKN